MKGKLGEGDFGFVEDKAGDGLLGKILEGVPAAEALHCEDGPNLA